jgi:D-tyrosyl-tRNA(Tyr) deacylase
VRLVLQRVTGAAVTVDGEVVGEIGTGMLLLAGLEASDQERDLAAAVEKVIALRVFPDETAAMNRSVSDVGGSVLVVSQFTLLADVRKGRRPSLGRAAPPEVAAPMFSRLLELFADSGVPTQSGVFGARMEVSLVNDGPVTLVLDVREGRVS